jgi:hypothetical protein
MQLEIFELEGIPPFNQVNLTTRDATGVLFVYHIKSVSQLKLIVQLLIHLLHTWKY